MTSRIEGLRPISEIMDELIDEIAEMIEVEAQSSVDEQSR